MTVIENATSTRYIPNKTNTLPLEIYFLVEQGKENQAWLWVLVLVAFSITAYILAFVSSMLI
jgi:ABC-type molybdate transport system permease subunit